MAAQFDDGETHSVFNQPLALENYNIYQSDRVLKFWLRQFGADITTPTLHDFGERCGTDLLNAGLLANKHLPELQSHDRFGHRLDQVNYHPAYHQLMAHAITNGHVSLPWATNKSTSHVIRGALAYMHTHADPGSGCPLTMTFASVPAISEQPNIADKWLPRILSGIYDERNVPWYTKHGVTIGMAMTEKQGGSDVRANTTSAQPVANSGPGHVYALTGHKWFCSAPMCDGFLVLAKVKEAISCFLVPRWRDDGSKNPIHIQRLKSKTGNQSNASAEIELRGAHGWLLGQEGRGINTIMHMVALTRHDCMLGSAALMAQSAKEAIWHTHGRSVFGKSLHQQPIMQNVLADLAIEAEAALAISLRISKALDNDQLAEEQALVRVATAVGKYWICKRAIQHTYEAMECVGGVGYITDSVLSRNYREAPVNAIWEGSGNVQCLDVLRIIEKLPDGFALFLKEINKPKGKHQHLDQGLAKLENLLNDKAQHLVNARSIVELLGLCWQGATLLEYGDPLIADAFLRSRLASNGLSQYGTLPADIDASYIIARAMPVTSHTAQEASRRDR